MYTFYVVKIIQILKHTGSLADIEFIILYTSKIISSGYLTLKIVE